MIVIVAFRAITIALNPFGILHEERVVYFPLKLGVNRTFSETISR